MTIASFMEHQVLVGVLSFFVALGYTALNETAAELEHPFGLGANHLALVQYMRQFNSKLARLFDQTIPQLGYMSTAVVTKERATTTAANVVRHTGTSAEENSHHRATFAQNNGPLAHICEHMSA